ncbi:hypothetical protein HC891_13585 [Candidatus Gracilibacteria bacterium]|nr:hypothetical protein [Candidatus Gracilibacteria bacterium]
MHQLIVDAAYKKVDAPRLIAGCRRCRAAAAADDLPGTPARALLHGKHERGALRIGWADHARHVDAQQRVELRRLHFTRRCA